MCWRRPPISTERRKHDKKYGEPTRVGRCGPAFLLAELSVKLQTAGSKRKDGGGLGRRHTNLVLK